MGVDDGRDVEIAASRREVEGQVQAPETFEAKAACRNDASMERRKPSTRFRGEPPPKRPKAPSPVATPRFKKTRAPIQVDVQPAHDDQPNAQATELPKEAGETFLQRYELS